jgi:hypothetical protein
LEEVYWRLTVVQLAQGNRPARLYPGLEVYLTTRPFFIRHGKPIGIAVAAPNHHVLTETALKNKAHTRCGGSAGAILGVTLPSHATVTQIMEQIIQQQKLRSVFADVRCTMYDGAKPHMTDLCTTVIDMNVQQTHRVHRLTGL